MSVLISSIISMALLATPISIYAQQQTNYVATLTGKDMVPPVNTPATGVARFHINPDGSLRSKPYNSPLQASIEQLKGLPPALIMTDEFDVLRSEVEAYAHKLIEAGVPVTATRYLGTTHDFVMLNVLADTPALKRGAISQASDHLKEHLWK